VVGLTALENFRWTVYVLGGLLVITGLKAPVPRRERVRAREKLRAQVARKHLRVTDTFAAGKFFVHEDGRKLATRLFLALIVVETTDIVFALDSVRQRSGSRTTCSSSTLRTSSRSVGCARSSLQSVDSYAICIT